jgi:hypothetical protein
MDLDKAASLRVERQRLIGLARAALNACNAVKGRTEADDRIRGQHLRECHVFQGEIDALWVQINLLESGSQIVGDLPQRQAQLEAEVSL